MDADQGFDVPPFEKLNDFGIWAAAEPPKGTLYNFPNGERQIPQASADAVFLG
jgi:hypothetical protein